MKETIDVAAALPVFLIVLLRTGIFFYFVPFFSSKNFPPQFRIGFAAALATVLTPIVDLKAREQGIPVLVLREAALSLVLGLAVRYVFLAFEVAGQVMSNAMGLSIATVFNPEFGQSTEVARLQGIFAMLLFLALDGHHDLIYLFVKSFELVPPGTADLPSVISEGISLGGKVFVIALKLAAPVTVGLVIANILLGFLYKAAPQMNIFFVSFPLYITIGFVIMLLSLPLFVQLMAGSVGDIRDELSRILAAARRG